MNEKLTDFLPICLDCPCGFGIEYKNKKCRHCYGMNISEIKQTLKLENMQYMDIKNIKL